MEGNTPILFVANHQFLGLDFVPPIAVPKPLAALHYFVFGRPVETVDVDPRDQDGCRRVYGEVREDLERGLEDVL